mmetsp:Transcript_19368/g.16581  ORF Transcript_19368/g.16581 Transcript_19368/m.16581 type:complete len:318 (+) Transcript_19368:37-990(+)
MNFTKSHRENLEVTIDPEDLPNFSLSRDVDPAEEQAMKEQTPIDVARAFLIELEKAFMAHQMEELLYLYDRKFNKISETIFKTTPWPSAAEVEDSSDGLEFDLTTHFLYGELCYRHIYARLQQITPEVRLKSFENYMNLFETFIETREKIILPIAWVYDILDEFLYQFQTFCQSRSKMKEDDPNMEIYLQDPDNIWNFEKVEWILQELVKKSGVIKDGKVIDAKEKTAVQYFGYFAIVSQLRLYVLVCDYENAIKSVECIDYQSIPIFTKAFNCLITLFYYTGFAYLMNKRYRESIKLFELVLTCWLKYKQFYSKSF